GVRRLGAPRAHPFPLRRPARAPPRLRGRRLSDRRRGRRVVHPPLPPRPQSAGVPGAVVLRCRSWRPSMRSRLPLVLAALAVSSSIPLFAQDSAKLGELERKVDVLTQEIEKLKL